MSSSISNIIKKLEDKQSARVKITVKGGTQHNFPCIYREDTPPHFYLVFQPNVLPGDIDLKSFHPVSVDKQSSSVTFTAKIITLKGDRTLYLSAKDTVDPASLREYFRINTATDITVSHTSSRDNSNIKNWSISGDTQDISGSGVLALFLNEPQSRDHLIIELFLPDKKMTVNAVGHVVRKKRLRNRKWQVALHFDSISTKHRDAIITFLLSVQRKQLRENVQAYDY